MTADLTKGTRRVEGRVWQHALVTGLVYIHSNKYRAPHLTGQTMGQRKTPTSASPWGNLPQCCWLSSHCYEKIPSNGFVGFKVFPKCIAHQSKVSIFQWSKVTTTFCVHSSKKSCFANQNSTKGCFTLKLGWQFQHIPQKAVKYDCWSWLS